MDLFSLEDEDHSSMFLTQSSSYEEIDISSGIAEKSGENEKFLGLEKTDFTSPCRSLVSSLYTPQCSDISDDEMVDKPNFE